jgi:hypothetical protein
MSPWARPAPRARTQELSTLQMPQRSLGPRYTCLPMRNTNTPTRRHRWVKRESHAAASLCLPPAAQRPAAKPAGCARATDKKAANQRFPFPISVGKLQTPLSLRRSAPSIAVSSRFRGCVPAMQRAPWPQAFAVGRQPVSQCAPSGCLELAGSQRAATWSGARQGLEFWPRIKSGERHGEEKPDARLRPI